MQHGSARMQHGLVAAEPEIRCFCAEPASDREIGYLLQCLGRDSTPEVAAAEDAAPTGWYHTVPAMGEYPSVINKPGGKKVKGTLVVDETAYSRILADFQARKAAANFSGLIVDLEHKSEIPDGSTEAAAWALAMERRADGIWTQWEKTDLGKAIIGGRYKFRSPAFDLEAIPGTRDRYRPVALSSIGLTNTPHFKTLAPSLNRAGTEEEDRMEMLQRLQALLKLPATADQDAVCGAVEALATKATADATALATAQTRVKELELADRTREANAFVSLYKGRINDEKAVREAYLKDPDGCKALFGSLKDGAAEAAKPRMLGRDAKTPASSGNEDNAARCRARASVISDIQRRDNCKRTVALARAERERPELFAKEEKGA